MSTNLRYPTNQVVAVVPDRASLSGLVDGLHDLGVDDPRIHVLRSADAEANHLAPDPDDVKGPIASLVQVVQKALGDEAARLEQLEAALDAGYDVVCVELVGTDDDADRDRQKHDIAAVLHAHGGRDVAYYGSLQIEQLDAGGTT